MKPNYMNHEQNVLMLTIFYLSKLSEFGLIDGGGYNITPKGFDLAYDLYQDGYEITRDEMEASLSEIMIETPKEIQIQMLVLTYQLYTVGIDKMKEQVEEMNTK